MIDQDEVLRRIDSQWKNDEGERRYLGASEIGDECSRKLWLKFHGYIKPEQFSPRMLRLFFRGKREEPVFETMLEGAGFEIIQSCLDQAGFQDGFFAGHGDGIYMLDGKRVAVEMKTHSAKSFGTLERGKLKISHPTHYAQCIVYSGKFECEYALYIAVNKDNDELFIDVIPFNAEEFNAYCDKAEFITMADKPPERIATSPTTFKCKFCNAHSVCWGFEMARVDCRNCTSVMKDRDNGAFVCEVPENKGKLAESGSCSKHSFNPYAIQGLIGWSAIEFHPKERSVTYEKPNGSRIINGQEPFGVASKNLTI